MILYVWIKKFKNLKEIGFNLSSRYKFNFEYSLRDDDVSGELTVTELKEDVNLFADYVSDVKAIIGKNGTGKSTMIATVIQSLLTDYFNGFEGLVVTDKFIFNRRGYSLTHKIKINNTLLKEIGNAAIVNFQSHAGKKNVSEEKAKTIKGFRIIDTLLNDHSVFYYSPLLNYDRVYETESIAAGHQIFEVDFNKFFDISTEAQMVADWESFSPFDYLELKSGSELLCHKSKESERILEYILNSESKLPITVNIPKITIHLNQFAVNYWEGVARQFKSDNEIQAPLLRFIDDIAASPRRRTAWNLFETQLLKNFLYFAMKYEVNYRHNFHSETNQGNAVVDTISGFEKAAAKAKTLNGRLKAYLTRSDFFKTNHPRLYNDFNRLILFLKRSNAAGKINVNNFSFEVSLKNRRFISDFMKQSYRFGGFRDDKKTFQSPDLGFSIFSYEFSGLSSGEKSLFHLLSRFHSYFKLLDHKRKNLIIFLDEPETGLHPQWQKDIISILMDFFKNELQKNFKVQVIITSHSPILISDLPRENVEFLDIDEKSGFSFVSHLSHLKNTFGANIHALYSDAFFIQKGAIGSFAKRQIDEVIKIIQTKDIARQQYAARIISVIGDVLIQQRLRDMYEQAFNTEPESITEKIARLEQELAYIKLLKENEDN